MTNDKRTMIAVAALGIAVLSGCKNLPASKPHDERSEGRVIDDQNITKRVEDRLQAEPVYKFQSVDVKAYGGIVQLSGFVNIPDQKRRAEEITREVPGVTQVVNALTLKPGLISTPSPTGQPTGERLSPPSGSTTDDRNVGEAQY